MSPIAILALAFIPLLQDDPQVPEQRIPAPRSTVFADPVRLPIVEGFRWPVVEIGINGQGPFRMILDTGAGVTVLNEDLVAELGIVSKGTRRIGDPSNPTAHEVDVLSIEALTFGAARFEGVEAVGWRGPALAAMGKIRGVLGFPTFADCLVTIDYAAGYVEIARGELPEPDGKEILPMKLGGSPSIPIHLAGVALDAHIDTGNTSSLVLPASLQERMPLVEGSLRRGKAVRAGLPTEFTIARVDGPLTIGGATIESPEVHFDDTLPVVNVGHEILSRFRLTFDQRSGRMRLAPASPRREAATGRPRRIGVQMAAKGGTTFVVTMVVPGSAGEAAGLTPGDALIEVAGQPFTQDALLQALRGKDSIELTIEREGERRTLTLFGG